MAFLEVNGAAVALRPHPGQAKALASKARIVLVCAGAQSGKTSAGPAWLFSECQARGPGDYLVATPSFSLLEFSALPKFREFFEDALKLGRYVASPSRRFLISPDGERRLFGHHQSTATTIRFGYASDSNSLEALTLKGAWLDEAGQKSFTRASWENILTRRLAVHRGRVFITTTPYYSDSWLKELCDKADAGDPDIELCRFDSTQNPAFPRESWETAQLEMEPHRFDLMFRGIFTRPPGLIYNAFLDSPAPQGHLIPRFEIPDHWPRFMGGDFGGVNTAFCFLAQGQDQYQGKYILYRTYHTGNLTAAEHTAALLRGEPSARPVCFGGAASEGNWRAEFGAAGLRIQKPPIQEIEVGISRVIAAFRTDQLLVMNDLRALLSELRTYSRRVDDTGKVTEEIDNKSTFHINDSLRYIMSHLRHQDVTNRIIRPHAGGGFA
jgi:hypothetical protein